MRINQIISLKNRVIIFILAFTLLSVAGVAKAQPVMAATPAEEACNSINAAFGGASCAAGTKDKSGATSIAQSVVNILSWVIGILAVIMMLVGGFRYIISGGDSAGISGAKNAIIYALVGLVIVVLAQVIVRYVVSNVAPAPAPTQPTPAPPSTP